MSAIFGDDTNAILGAIISLMTIIAAVYGVFAWQAKKVRDSTSFKVTTQQDIVSLKESMKALEDKIEEQDTKMDSKIFAFETKLETMYCENKQDFKEMLEKSNDNMLNVTSAISHLTGKIEFLKEKL